MKKLLALFALLFVLAALVACGENGNTDIGGGNKDYQTGGEQIDDDTPPSVHTHEYGEWEITKNPTCGEDGTKERSCSCGDKQTETVAMTGQHVSADAVKEKEIDATCEEDGSYDEVVYCKNCNAELMRDTKILPKAAHSLNGVCVTADTFDYGTDGINLFDGEIAKCGVTLDGYYICEGCSDEILVKVKVSHVGAEKWIITTEPTCTEDGEEYYGCDSCGAVIGETRKIPAGHDYCVGVEEIASREELFTTRFCGKCGLLVNEMLAPASKEVIPGINCIQGDKVCYTFVCSDGYSFSATVAGEQLKHTLNGTLVTGLLVYGTPGVELLADSNLVCDGSATGYFECEVCCELVTAEVLFVHGTEGKWFTSQPSTCFDDGEEYYGCLACGLPLGDDVRVVPAGHTYTYDFRWTGNPNEFVIEKYCFGCGMTVIELVTTDDGEKVSEATCGSGSVTRYTFNDSNGKTYVINIVNDDQLPCYHTLNGEEAPDDITYVYGTPGIKLFAGDYPVCCSTTSGYFMCEVCEEAVCVNVEVEHTSVGYITLTEPTCTQSGEAYYGCQSCREGMGGTRTLPEKGHDYQCVFESTVDHKTFVIVKTCVECSHVSKEEVALISWEIASVATCGQSSVIRCTYVDSEGETCTADIENDDDEYSCHWLNGEEASCHTKYAYGTPGIKLFAGSKNPVCGEETHGYFICEACGWAVSVNVYRNHEYKDGSCVHCGEKEQ